MIFTRFTTSNITYNVSDPGRLIYLTHGNFDINGHLSYRDKYSSDVTSRRRDRALASQDGGRGDGVERALGSV